MAEAPWQFTRDERREVGTSSGGLVARLDLFVNALDRPKDGIHKYDDTCANPSGNLNLPDVPQHAQTTVRNDGGVYQTRKDFDEESRSRWRHDGTGEGRSQVLAKLAFIELPSVRLPRYNRIRA